MTVSTGEASLVADLAPRTGIDLPPSRPPPARRSCATCRRWATSATRWIPWGADEEAAAYGAAFEAMAASGAYDVLAIVHDSPFRDLPSEVEVAHDGARRADRGDGRPARDPARLRAR